MGSGDKLVWWLLCVTGIFGNLVLYKWRPGSLENIISPYNSTFSFLIKTTSEQQQLFSSVISSSNMIHCRSIIKEQSWRCNMWFLCTTLCSWFMHHETRQQKCYRQPTLKWQYPSVSIILNTSDQSELHKCRKNKVKWCLENLTFWTFLKGHRAL